MRTQVFLNFNSTVNAQIEKSDSSAFNNVSNVEDVYLESSLGYKGFQLSASRNNRVSILDGTSYLYPDNGYPGIIFQEISDDDDKTFTNPPFVTFVLRGQDFDKLYIAFDQASKEYATLVELIINGNTYTIENDSIVLDIDLNTYVSTSRYSEYTITVKFIKWSSANSNAKVTYISYIYTEIFTGNTIESITCSENALNSQAFVQPGIVEQYADISIYDRYKRLRNRAKQGKLQSSADIKIVAIDNENTQKMLGTYIVSNWEIESNSLLVKISAVDPSVNFDKITVENISLRTRNIHEMLQLLFGYVNTYKWKYIDEDTCEYCKAIEIPNSWLQTSTLEDAFRKVCTSGMLRIYWSNDYFIVMRCW